MKSISFLKPDERHTALTELYTSLFRYKLRKHSAKALFAASYIVEGYESSCPEKSIIRFKICMAMLFGTGPDMLSALARIFAQVLPGVIPSLVNIRTFSSKFRLGCLREWELQNTPTGMRVNLVKAVRFF